MKFVWMLLVTFVYMHADEVQRIDAIISDITQLRSEYNNCTSEVKTYSDKLQHQEDIIQKFEKKELEYKQRIMQLQEQLQKLQKLKKPKKVFFKKQKSVVCKDDNPFPKLKLKKKYQNITVTKAHTYKLIHNASIYNNFDGSVIDDWEQETSFTSNIRSEDMIKITGYFVKKSWVKAAKDMWIKAEDVKLR